MKMTWRWKVLEYSVTHKGWFYPRTIRDKIPIKSKAQLSGILNVLVDDGHLRKKKINKRDYVYRYATEGKQDTLEYFKETGKLPAAPKMTKQHIKRIKKSELNWRAKRDIKKINQLKMLQYSSMNQTIFGLDFESLPSKKRFLVFDMLSKIESSLTSISKLANQEKLILVGEPLIPLKSHVVHYDKKQTDKILREINKTIKSKTT